MINSKKGCNKLYFIYAFITLLIVLFYYFNVSIFGEFSIINSLPDFNFSITDEIKNVLSSFFGSSQSLNMIFYYFQLQILYLVVIYLPCSIYNWVRGLICK